MLTVKKVTIILYDEWKVRPWGVEWSRAGLQSDVTPSEVHAAECSFMIYRPVPGGSDLQFNLKPTQSLKTRLKR